MLGQGSSSVNKNLSISGKKSSLNSISSGLPARP